MSSNSETKQPQKVDGYYFDSYAHLSIHEDMIRDKARTDAYRDAMIQNKRDFADKVVVDVGCGTSILSFFAMQAGASKVYGIDASNIIDMAKKIVAQNRAEGKIILFRGKAEEVELPEKADIIISEWMGYALLYEAMLPSVIAIRDKYMKPEGKMYPRYSNIWLCPFSDPDYYNSRVGFWSKNLYGLDFTPLQQFAVKCAFEEPHVEFIASQSLISFPAVIVEIDCQTVTAKELEHFESDFAFKCIYGGELSGFALWFDCVFDGSQKKIVLKTGPDSTDTHWKQTLFYFDEMLEMEQDEEITGKIDIKQNQENSRYMDFEIWFQAKGRSFHKKFHLK